MRAGGGLLARYGSCGQELRGVGSDSWAKYAKPAQTSKPALLAFVPAYCSLGGAWGVLPRFYAGPLAHDWFRLAVTGCAGSDAREPVKPQEIVSAATCITQGLAQLLAFKRGTHTKIVLLQPASFTAGGGRAAKLP